MLRGTRVLASDRAAGAGGLGRYRSGLVDRRDDCALPRVRKRAQQPHLPQPKAPQRQVKLMAWAGTTAIRDTGSISDRAGGNRAKEGSMRCREGYLPNPEQDKHKPARRDPTV